MVVRQVLAVREYCVPMPGLDGRGDGLRIAHISDFHFRGWNHVLEQARWRLMVPDYDLLLVTGDFSALPGSWRRAANMCRRFFDGITPRLGTYAVLGNHDRPRLAEQPGLPFRWLRNESVRIDVNGAPLYLAGTEQCAGTFGDVSEAIAETPEAGPVILLAHYPSTAFDVPAGRVQLQLSGHTHGGQVRLPWLGCVFTNDRIPTRMARGLHRIGGTLVHVTAGLGTSGTLPYRFRCPPEVSILTLEAAGTEVKGCGRMRRRVREYRHARELALQV